MPDSVERSDHRESHKMKRSGAGDLIRVRKYLRTDVKMSGRMDVGDFGFGQKWSKSKSLSALECEWYKLLFKRGFMG